MTIEIADYSASLLFPSLTEETVQQIKETAQAVLGFDVSVGSRHLEFEYNGRDPGRKVVTFLCQAASLIGTADGEIECRLTTSADDVHFEFYSIRHGRLFRQEAEIVRMPPSEVCLEMPEAERQPISVG